MEPSTSAASSSSSTSPSARRTARVPLLVAAALLFAGSVAAAARQAPPDNPFQPVTGWDAFWKPTRENDFASHLSIQSELSALYVLPGTDHMWVGGSGGLILWSEDAGENWNRAEVRGTVGVPLDTGRYDIVPTVDTVTSTADTSAAFSADTAGPPAASTRAMGRRLIEWFSPAPLYAQSGPVQSGPRAEIDSSCAPRPRAGRDPPRPNLGNTPAQPEAPRSNTPVGGYSARIIDIQFTSASVGWATSAAGHLLSSTDGGRTWTVIRAGMDESRLTFNSAGRGWAYSESGYAARFIDGKEDWRQLSAKWNWKHL
ncbi:MAG: hypothetical protein AVDCRST_MAG89-1801, partial [uncultured Gemmatimonadetes bacterium]